MRNSEVVKQFLDAMMTSDIDVMKQRLSMDVVWHPPTSVAHQFQQRVDSLEEVVSFRTENPEKFYEPTSRYAVVLHVVSEDDLVSVHFNFHATPRKGGKLCTCANWMFKLRHEKIVEVWEVLDIAQWNNAVLPT